LILYIYLKVSEIKLFYPDFGGAQKGSSGKEEPAALFQVEYLALEGGGG